MSEQEHHKRAFEFYYGLGEGRNYSKVAEELGVSIAAVKTWGRNFGWKRRVGERDAEAARVIAERGMKDTIERGLRNRKLVEMGLVQVAKAIAEGKAKVTVADLDRLIRLEEFLKEEKVGEQTKLIVEWVDYNDPARKKDGETGGPGTGG